MNDIMLVHLVRDNEIKGKFVFKSEIGRGITEIMKL